MEDFILRKIKEINEQQKTINQWISQTNINSVIGESREKIFSKFGNDLKPIATLHDKFLDCFNGESFDNKVYCGQGYLINHVVNHHNYIPLDTYKNIQNILDNPDEIIIDDRRGNDIIIFAKQLNRNIVIALSLEKNNDKQLVIHKFLAYNRNKKTYPSLDRVFVPVDAHPQSVISFLRYPPVRRLSALGINNINKDFFIVNLNKLMIGNNYVSSRKHHYQ